MLELGINGYTRQEVIDQLHGKNGSRGLVKIRYDLLNRQDVKLGELMVQSGRVSMNSLAEIKRTALFELTEQEGKDVDWLNDRIRPVFCLKMPEIRKTYKAWGKIDTSFSRSSIAYLSDGTRVTANVPRFEPGKFGKAIMVEEGTENIIPIADWNAQNGWALAWGTQTRTIETTGLLFNGVNIIKSVIESTGQAVIFKDFAVSTTPGVVYTISAFVKSQGRPVRIWCHDGSNNGQVSSSSNVPGTDFTRLTVQFTTTGTGYCRVHFLSLSGNVGDIVWVTAPQLEQKPYATSFIDGTRAAESLTIPTAGVLNPQEGTVECWAYVNPDIHKQGSDWNMIFVVTDSNEANQLRFGYNRTSGKWHVKTTNSAGAAWYADFTVSSGWHHFALTWNQSTTTAKMYVDGIIVAQETSAPLPSAFASTACIGSWLSSANVFNSLIDDLRISNRARSDAEILAAYQSGQPAPIDEWTTAKFDFDNRLTGEYFTIVNDSKPVQWIEWPLGVFLLSSPTRKDENRKVKRSIEAYDSSLIIKEDKFTDRYVIEAGTKYTDAIIDILNAAGIWKINIIDHPGTLATDREFEIGTTKLFAVNELLAAINYTSLWVDENGYFMAAPYVLPSSRDPEYEYRTDDLSIIRPGAEEELDLFAVPNKFVRYVSNPDRAVILRSEYTNDLSTSPISTINRGRTIVDIDHVEDIYDQATLDEYVKRIAYNASQVYGKFDFVTALMPHHSYYNCLFIEYDGLGIAHKYMESSWSMDLHANGVMRHSCRRVIQI